MPGEPWKPCILWTGARNEKGYGKKRVGKRVIGVHKAVWEEAFGPVPPGMDVLHHCTNRHCYELTHLFIGQSRRRRGRKGLEGERNGKAKLTRQQVQEMRERYAKDGEIGRAHV